MKRVKEKEPVNRIVPIILLFLLFIPVAGFLSVGRCGEIVDFKSPEIDFGQLNFEIGSQIPDTNIRFGTINISGVRKIAFDIRNNLYYLEFSKIDKTRDMKMGFVAYSDIDFGVYNNRFLIMRGFEGATGRNAWLFLFGIEKDNIRLIDVMQNDYIESRSYDFFLNFQEEMDLYGIKRKGKKDPSHFSDIYCPLIDRDNDGNPEVKLFFVDLKFDLFVEASEGGLKVDLNPNIYKKQFELLKTKAKKDEEGFRNYLIYGFITNVFERDRIKKLTHIRGKGESEEIMKVIDSLGELNSVLHPKEQIILKKFGKRGE